MVNKRKFLLPITLLIALITLPACLPGTPAPPPTPVPPSPTPLPATPTPAVHATLAPLPKTRSSAEAVTVLLLGTDRRNPEWGTDNTDTLMVFHLNPDAQRAVILSLPRDLYVEIPGHGQGRINSAYVLGELDGTGGLALARQTVSATLGIPIHHAVLINFEAFITLIDAIGGVDVEVPYDIYDPTYPDADTGYDPFYLPAGEHHLDGATALKYVRTRATPGGDFDRTARQRRLVLAVRDQVMRLDLLPGLIARSPQLWNALRGALETDLTLGEIVDLSVSAARIPPEHIVTAGIDETCTSPWTTPEGAQVLLPLPDKIAVLVADLFSPHTATAQSQ